MVTEILNAYEPETGSITLVPTDGGKFEITVNNRLLFSKQELNRHAEPGEVIELIRKYLEEQK